MKALEARWESIVDLLGNESLPEYLRVYWNSRNPLTRKTALFKTIRGAIRNRADAFELIRNLDRCARVYAALQSPADREWSSEERDGLTQLRLFNVRQPFAVLLAAFDRLGEPDRAEPQTIVLSCKSPESRRRRPQIRNFLQSSYANSPFPYLTLL